MKDFDIIKKACQMVYYSGCGDFWFENNVVGDEHRMKYKLYRGAVFLVYIVTTVLEILAVAVGDFPEGERGEAITFSLSHTIVMMKFLLVQSRKKHVRDLNRDVVYACSRFEDDRRASRKYQLIKINVVAYILVVYGTWVFYIFEGLRRLYFEGYHFVTVVTYWPEFHNDSPIATCYRVLNTIFLAIMIMPMVAIDSFVVTHLIVVKYKFITLRHYFNTLDNEFKETAKKESLEKASDVMWDRCIEGIKIHQGVLRIAKNVEKTFALLIAAQVGLGFASDISLLLQLVLSEDLSPTQALKLILFMTAILFLLAQMLCNAGEITYQASLLADAVFHSGWHRARGAAGRALRHATCFTVAIAQKELQMKAFKMLKLTYATFFTVVRSMYSVFALLHAKKIDTMK